MNLEFGLSHAVPEAVKSAWGARLIYPDDLLRDRQGLVVENDAEKAKLIGWLNGEPSGSGAIKAAKEMAVKAANAYKISRDGRQEVILHQDAVGVIVACPNASCGYLYVAGWLHEGDAAKLPAAEFQPIVIEKRAYEEFKPPYVCGDGKRYNSRKLALNHAKKVLAQSGRVISVEYHWGDEPPMRVR